MEWLKRLFQKKPQEAPESIDMRETPVENPFDYREDGSIREGDPAWAVMMESMQTGNVVIGNQRPDGTWDIQEIPSQETPSVEEDDE